MGAAAAPPAPSASLAAAAAAPKAPPTSTPVDAPPSVQLDVVLLFAARALRLASYGGLTVVLLLYLEALSLTPSSIGALLTAIFVGDVGVTVALTSHADAVGRRRTLMASAVLKAGAGVAFALSDQFWVLVRGGHHRRDLYEWE